MCLCPERICLHRFYVKRLETRLSMVVLVFYVIVIINIQTENYRGLISSQVVTCPSVKTFALEFLQEFQAFSNSERFELVNNASDKRWVGFVHVCNEPKNKFQN